MSDEEQRTAEDVYWDYADQFGLDDCEDAVLNYFNPTTAVQLLLEYIDADSLDEFLSDNLVASPTHPPHALEPSSPLAGVISDYCLFAELFEATDASEISVQERDQRLASLLSEQQDLTEACLGLRHYWQEYSFTDEETRSTVAEHVSGIETGTGTVGHHLHLHDSTESESTVSDSHNWKKEGF